MRCLLDVALFFGCSEWSDFLDSAEVIASKSVNMGNATLLDQDSKCSLLYPLDETWEEAEAQVARSSRRCDKKERRKGDEKEWRKKRPGSLPRGYAIILVKQCEECPLGWSS